MTVHATAPSLSLFPQRSPISDPALAQALPRKQTDRDLGLIQPTAVLGGVVHGEPIPQPASGLFAEAFHHRLARMRTQIVQHPMDGVRLRVADRDLPQVVSKLRRGAVGRHLGEVPSCFRLHSAEYVGRTATFVFAVASRRATRPGLMAWGGRTSWWSTTGFSSTQTTGSRSLSGFSYTAKMSSMRRMYSSSSSATHPIFFPPRLQVVVFQQDPNRFPSHSRNQFAFHHFFAQQAHRPARAAFRRWATRQRHDALPVLLIQQGRFPRPWPLVPRPFQAALPIALAGEPSGFLG